jgi:chaperone required for assembly of F1-ATPase
MRDIFDDIFKSEPLDPMEAARRNARPTLRKRFYKSAGVTPEGGQFVVTLDGKPVRTPARRPLAAPTRELAQAIADEWQAQTDVIDPAHMPLTRLANSIIDGVADKSEDVRNEIVKYLGSDLLFYRADGPEGLIERQAQHWDPIVRWAAEQLGARFIMVEGVVFAAQPEEAIAAAAKAIPADAWRLGAAHSVMTLTGSALLALALAENAIDADQAWKAAHVDEDWQMEQWGRDTLAMERRAHREAEMKAAAAVMKLCGAPA